VNKDVRIRGYFSKLKGIREKNDLESTDLDYNQWNYKLITD